MVLMPVKCPVCDGIEVIKHGRTANGKQRFVCQDRDCEGQTFIQDYSEKGRLPETKQQIIEMALNGSGVRDTARVLNISTATVIKELKKRTGAARCESRFFSDPQARGEGDRYYKSRGIS